MSACMLKRSSEASKETISVMHCLRNVLLNKHGTGNPRSSSEVFFFSDREHAAMVWYVVCLIIRLCYQSELLARRLLIKYNHALKGKPFKYSVDFKVIRFVIFVVFGQIFRVSFCLF